MSSPPERIESASALTLIGVALTSASLLMTELALTRIFSVTMYYHFAFLAISIALFGLSASGVWIFVARNRLEHSRLGLSVSKRCWKDAVPRNRVRRIFREAFRLSLSELPAGLDVVMIAGLPRLDPPLAETRRELVQLVQRAARSLAIRASAEQKAP